MAKRVKVQTGKLKGKYGYPDILTGAYGFQLVPKNILQRMADHIGMCNIQMEKLTIIFIQVVK